MAKFRKGDKVEYRRPGVVSNVYGSSVRVAFTDTNEISVILTDTDARLHLVEKAKLQEGDEVTDASDYANLPNGTLVESETGNLFVQTNLGWHGILSCNNYSARQMATCKPRTIKYLPES